MPYRPHRLEPNYPGPEVVTTKSPAPPVVVECWCLMVATMNRVRLDRFTRETWRKFDAKDLEPLKWAILRRRQVLAPGVAFVGSPEGGRPRSGPVVRKR